jgi:hypothetical protein
MFFIPTEKTTVKITDAAIRNAKALDRLSSCGLLKLVELLVLICCALLTDNHLPISLANQTNVFDRFMQNSCTQSLENPGRAAHPQTEFTAELKPARYSPPGTIPVQRTRPELDGRQNLEKLSKSWRLNDVT